MNRQELLEHGYKPFTQKNLRSYTDQFYQKCICDSQGKKYFITVAEYDRGEQDFSYEADCQFTADDIVFNVQMLHNDEFVEEMEGFFASLWFLMNCDYYERFEYDPN